MSSSYVHGTATVPLLGQTIGASLDRVAAQFGNRDALISCHQNARYTYAQLLDEVNGAARGFLALGVKRGDRVGIWSANVAEWLITQYAVAKVGAILVNLNPAYKAAELVRLRLERQLRDSEERLRDLYEEAPIAYVQEDLESRFLSANRAAQRIALAIFH